MPELPFPSDLIVRPWLVRSADTPRFDPRSCYVECCYLPILGPSATWLYRRLGTWMAASPKGLVVDLAELAAEHGLGRSIGPHSTLGRSLNRLVKFDLAWRDEEDLLVRPAAPALRPRQAARLGVRLQALEASLRQQADQA